jgi:hypothetical protein
VRNSVGGDVDPRTGKYWFTENARDWISDDLPSDKLNMINKIGSKRARVSQQKHIARLASITESRIEVVHQRRYFWDEVHERLDQLGNRISLYDRRRIEAAIALKVPRLSQAEHDASIEKVQENFSDYNHKPYRPST